jgi:hypothetical protein
VRGLSNIYSWQGSSRTISWAITRHAINRLCKPEAITVFVVFFWVGCCSSLFLSREMLFLLLWARVMVWNLFTLL